MNRAWSAATGGKVNISGALATADLLAAHTEGDALRGERWRDFEPGLRGELQPLDSGVGGGTTKLDDL